MPTLRDLQKANPPDARPARVLRGVAVGRMRVRADRLDVAEADLWLLEPGVPGWKQRNFACAEIAAELLMELARYCEACGWNADLLLEHAYRKVTQRMELKTG